MRKKSYFLETKLLSWFQEIEENFAAINLTTSALHTRLEEEETQNETHGKRITALENNLAQIDDLKLTTRLTEIENNEVDVQMKLQNLESADVFLQEAHRLPFKSLFCVSIFSIYRMLMEKSSGVELELKQMDINFDQLRQSTENKIQNNLQTIANNNKQSQANAESIKRWTCSWKFEMLSTFDINLKLSEFWVRFCQHLISILNF